MGFYWIPWKVLALRYFRSFSIYFLELSFWCHRIMLQCFVFIQTDSVLKKYVWNYFSHKTSPQATPACLVPLHLTLGSASNFLSQLRSFTGDFLSWPALCLQIKKILFLLAGIKYCNVHSRKDMLLLPLFIFYPYWHIAIVFSFPGWSSRSSGHVRMDKLCMRKRQTCF